MSQSPQHCFKMGVVYRQHPCLARDCHAVGGKPGMPACTLHTSCSPADPASTKPKSNVPKSHTWLTCIGCSTCCIKAVSAFWLCRLQLDDLTGQHETYARQLRDRLLREQDLAVERERAAAQDRLREAAERCPLLPCIQRTYPERPVQRINQKITERQQV